MKLALHGRWIVIAVALGAVLFDVAAGASWSGVPAAVALIGLVALLVTNRIRRPTRLLRMGRRLLLFDFLLLIGAILFAAARLFVLYEQMLGAGAQAQMAARTYDLVFVGLAGGASLLESFGAEARSIWELVAKRPAALLMGSFAGMIIVGTLLLTLPLSVENVADVSLLDALFTITSAVCVTGLAVNDIGTIYTFFGQLVILASIQLGGIGIMTIAALALSFRGDARLSEQTRYAEVLEVRRLGDLRGTVAGIVTATVLIEAAGAVFLWLIWSGDPRLDGRPSVWFAIFHAISAFCNAGFSLFSKNLMDFRSNEATQIVLMFLIVSGGIGFTVIQELVSRLGAGAARLVRRGPGPRRTSLAVRVPLAMTAFLIVFGAIAIGVLDAGATLAPLSVFDHVLNALFSSVTARTAGFNTLDFGAMSPATLIVVMSLMFVGGSPASCAGGVKTTTLAVLVSAIDGELRGREPELFGRAISPETLRRATAVFMLSLSFVGLVLLLLTLTESATFLQLSFEAVSAFSTTGLSTGITPSLGVAGKLILVGAMFVGRVGPLTIALAVGRSSAPIARYRLAREELPIG
jgi:trk system potassium uptake protein